MEYNLHDLSLLKGHGIDGAPFTYYRAWMKILQKFTACDLTNHTDKLIAISGLARKLHIRLGPSEEYVAGLWRKYLYLQLLWNVQGRHKSFQRLPYRAPSWSWACVEGNIYNHRTYAEAFLACKPLIRAWCETQLASGDPYGGIRFAVLHVEGQVFKANLGPRGGIQANTLAPLYVSGNLVTDRPINLDFAFPGSGQIEVYYLIVVQETNIGQEAELVGLVLMRQAGVKGRYVRIGLAFVLPSKLLLDAKAWPLVDEADYEKRLENGNYKISIV